MKRICFVFLLKVNDEYIKKISGWINNVLTINEFKGTVQAILSDPAFAVSQFTIYNGTL